MRWELCVYVGTNMCRCVMYFNYGARFDLILKNWKIKILKFKFLHLIACISANTQKDIKRYSTNIVLMLFYIIVYFKSFETSRTISHTDFCFENWSKIWQNNRININAAKTEHTYMCTYTTFTTLQYHVMISSIALFIQKLLHFKNAIFTPKWSFFKLLLYSNLKFNWPYQHVTV
jgi:hypothetical protein